MAINKSMGLLRGLYEQLLLPPISQQAKALWPNPTLDPPNPVSTKQQLPKLNFLSKVNHANGAGLSVIDEENERHGIYLAQMQIKASEQVVFVKFATRYNEEAHRLLANHDPPLAPTLHSCVHVIGGMHMVVMEYIPKSRGWSIDPHSSADNPHPPPAPAVINRDVTKALGLLHEGDFVFGDLREANLLYLPEDGGRVLFVDFDGVGMDGKDRYSACLNPNLQLGVKRWQIMEKKHDCDNLEAMMERVSDRYKRAH
jgi:serine/threonine protein kinase